MKKIIVITGPTGVGKTKMSIELAKIYNGEIINADSMQIYKDLNIGTAKIKKEEKEEIPHHLFDVKDVTEEYSIYHYQKDCRDKIEEIFRRGKVPILVGGTGLYIKSALYDYQLEEKKGSFQSYDGRTTEELYQDLIGLDEKAIGRITPNNRQRIINALNFYQNNHYSITENKTNKLLYDTIFIGLTTERNNLYHIINRRVDQMLEEGLLEEVKLFYDRKIYAKPLTGGIGYKELYEYFNGKYSLDEAIELVKRNSRRYAKRQYTFFNHQLPVVWFETNYKNFGETVLKVREFIDHQINL